MNSLTLLVFLIFNLISTNLEGKTLEHLTCVDVPTCNLLKILVPSTQIHLAFKITGDPHHFSPSTQEVKSLLTAQTLVLPSRDLAPWASGLQKKRLPSVTIEIDLHKLSSPTWSQQIKTYPHQMAHYWLYPDIHCEILGLLAKNLEIKWDPASCPFLAQNEKLLDLKTKLSAKKFPQVILTHDALLPLLEFLGMGPLALKTSHHHSGVSTKVLAELRTIGMGDCVIIKEQGIFLPPGIEKELAHLGHCAQFSWDPLGKLEDGPEKPLNNLLDFLTSQL